MMGLGLVPSRWPLAPAIAALLLSFAALGSSASIPQDQHVQVTSLPGWQGPLPSRMFSGFVYCGPPPGIPNGSMHMHYLWVESEHDPINDPIIVWYNGGPGASSMFGLLVELGPLLLNTRSYTVSSSSGVPRMIRNPYSWSKVANLLIVNSPPPVGFSYCLPAGPAGPGTSCGAWDDALVARANHQFLTRLFAGALISHSHAPVFLAGESYAGVYVPTIAREILADPKSIRLAGFAVGDGCLGTSVLCGALLGPYFSIQFLHGNQAGHGQVSEHLYNLIRTSCPEDQLRSGQNLSAICQELLQRMQQELGGFYGYDLLDECYWTGDSSFLKQLSERQLWGPAVKQRMGSVGDSPCPGDAMDRWLALPEVRHALHVPLDSNFFSVDNAVGFNYTLSEQDVRPIHLQAANSLGLRVLVYNGDTDPGLNSFVTQDKLSSYFEQQGLSLVESWRPWTLDGHKKQVGYTMQYQGNWTFATIRGAGHMVPMNKPQASLELIASFIRGESLKPYTRG